MGAQETVLELLKRVGGVFLLGGIVLFFAWPRSKQLEYYLGDNEGLLFSQRQINPSEVMYLQARPLPKTNTDLTLATVNTSGMSTARSQPAYFVFTSRFLDPVNKENASVQDPVDPLLPVLSALSPTDPANGPSAPECSTDLAGQPKPSCSARDGQYVQQCSVENWDNVTAETAKACSVHIDETAPAGDRVAARCSTLGDPRNQNGYCSTWVVNPDQRDNRMCSVLGNDPNQNPRACSTDISSAGGALICSTTGGDSNDGVNGPKANPSCSVGAQTGEGENPGEPGFCSVLAVGDNRSGNCSTFTGEHQNCSAGLVGTGSRADCSVVVANTGNPDPKPQFCSVNNAPPTPAPPETTYNNKCSVMNGPVGIGNSDDGAAYHCSVLAGDDFGGGFCSVLSTATFQGSNTVCTALTGDDQASCSTRLGVGGNDQQRCSVITLGPPTVVDGQGEICGDPDHRQHEVPNPSVPDTQTGG